MNVYWSQMMMVMVVVVRATRGVPVFVLLQRGRTTAACWLAGPLIISQTLMRLSLLTSLLSHTYTLSSNSSQLSSLLTSILSSRSLVVFPWWVV